MLNFDDAGEKLKSWAKFWRIAGIIVAVAAAIVLFTKDLFWVGVAVAVAGILGSFLGSLILHGFGELVENSRIAARDIGLVQQNTRVLSEKAKKSE